MTGFLVIEVGHPERQAIRNVPTPQLRTQLCCGWSGTDSFVRAMAVHTMAVHTVAHANYTLRRHGMLGRFHRSCPSS